MDLTAELKRVVRGEVMTETAVLDQASTDASIFKIEPRLVIRPLNSEDVVRLVQYVAAVKPQQPELSLTARSGGTDMSGGPLTDSVVVEFTPHFNRIIEVGREPEIPTGAGYAIVEPGVYYRDFEKVTLEQGLIMPSYPASREICTVGGIVANNSGGEKSLTYGKTEKYVAELTVILSDGREHVFKPLSAAELEEKKKADGLEGRIYREMHALLEQNFDLIQKSKPNVSKNSAGYYLWNIWDRRVFDLTRLLTGAQGTLGLITRIKFRLVPVKPHTGMLVMFLKDLDHLGEIIKTVRGYGPESFESYDDNTFALAIRFLPEMLRRMKGNLFRLALKFLPEIWLTITGGVPKLVLIAEFASADPAALQAKLRSVQAAVKKDYGLTSRITKDAAETQKYWIMRRESFNLLRQHVRGKHTAPFIDDIVVRPEQLPVFLPRLHRILEPYRRELTYTVAGHAGDGNFHIIPLMDLKDPAQRALIPDLSAKVYDLIKEFNGSITGEHNDGIIRTPYLDRMYSREILALFQKTKDIFDPQNIFNPGKKVGGDLRNILKYMKTD